MTAHDKKPAFPRICPHMVFNEFSLSGVITRDGVATLTGIEPVTSGCGVVEIAINRFLHDAS